MRGTGQTFSRLPRARLVLAGAALIAGTLPALAGEARAKAPLANDTALAVPRTAPLGPSGVGLPQPLSPSTAARVRRIFALQAAGKLKAAAQLTARLSDRLLLGHLLADKYLGPYYYTPPAELAAWLRRYANLPEAPAIRSLLASRLPRGWRLPAIPSHATLPEPLERTGQDFALPPPRDQIAGLTRNPWLDQRVESLAAQGQSGLALRTINASPGVGPEYRSLLLGLVARELFLRHDDSQARRFGSAALRAAGGRVGYGGFFAGLAAWRGGATGAALSYFAAAARARLAASDLTAAADFWAARAALRTAAPKRYIVFLQRAASYRRSFYGQMARHLLGLDLGLDPSEPVPVLGEADLMALDAIPAGRRAFALIEVGLPELAAAELAGLWPILAKNPALARTVVLVAAYAGMPGLANRLVLAFHPGGKTRPEIALPSLVPSGGFVVDPALVYALTRVESNFNAYAVSASGAQGLMQIMPRTAWFVAQTGDLPSIPLALRNGEDNLAIGQRYLGYLAQQPGIGPNLLRILASYNSGPGTFLSWGASLRDESDPLMFLESIPNDETRRFVRVTLAFSWLYAKRLGRVPGSLYALSLDRWPRFVPFAYPLAFAAAGESQN